MSRSTIVAIRSAQAAGASINTTALPRHTARYRVVSQDLGGQRSSPCSNQLFTCHTFQSVLGRVEVYVQLTWAFMTGRRVPGYLPASQFTCCLSGCVDTALRLRAN